MIAVDTNVLIRLAAIVLAQIDPGTSQGRLQGHVVDSGGAAIPAIIRLIDPETKNLLVRVRANEDGAFQTGLAPGVYSFTAFSVGFRRRDLAKIVIKAGHVTDLGKIVLNFSGCDSPGMNCDYVGDIPEHNKRIIAQYYVTLSVQCAVDLDSKGETVCPEQRDDVLRSKDADIRLTKENGALYFTPLNKAALSRPNASTSDCLDSTYENERIAVVGLGPGVDFCVTTKRGAVAHVFFTDDVASHSTAVALWYVTRWRP